MPYILHRIPQARFLIGGSGPLTNNLKDMAKGIGLENYVVFTGNIRYDRMPDYLNASTVYVSTSLSDGTSCSLLEAMACGLAVVVADIPGNREWVKDGDNGFLVTVQDHGNLAEKVVSLLSNKELRELFGDKNVEIAEARADWKVHARTFNETIEGLLNRNSLNGS